MILHINDDRLLREIQMDFSKFYPYLRLEFFDKSHLSTPSFPESSKISPYIKAGSVRLKHHEGAIYLFPNTTVKEVEEMMQKEFSLSVQISHYTKSGWIQTDVADMAMLDELNDQGRREFHELHNVSAQGKNLF